MTYIDYLRRQRIPVVCLNTTRPKWESHFKKEVVARRLALWGVSRDFDGTYLMNVGFTGT